MKRLLILLLLSSLGLQASENKPGSSTSNAGGASSLAQTQSQAAWYKQWAFPVSAGIVALGSTHAVVGDVKNPYGRLACLLTALGIAGGVSHFAGQTYAPEGMTAGQWGRDIPLAAALIGGTLCKQDDAPVKTFALGAGLATVGTLGVGVLLRVVNAWYQWGNKVAGSAENAAAVETGAGRMSAHSTSHSLNTERVDEECKHGSNHLDKRNFDRRTFAQMRRDFWASQQMTDFANNMMGASAIGAAASAATGYAFWHQGASSRIQE